MVMRQQRKLDLQLRYKNQIHGSSKKLTNTTICSVVDQEFERVRDFKYFALILTENDVN
jgi:hypothetical protein